MDVAHHLSGGEGSPGIDAASLRSAYVERAKGVLMGRYDVTEREAYAMLRRHARRSNMRLVDVASAVLDSHELLADRPR